MFLCPSLFFPNTVHISRGGAICKRCFTPGTGDGWRGGGKAPPRHPFTRYGFRGGAGADPGAHGRGGDPQHGGLYTEWRWVAMYSMWIYPPCGSSFPCKGGAPTILIRWRSTPILTACTRKKSRPCKKITPTYGVPSPIY